MTEELKQNIIGKTFDEAKKFLKNKGYSLRHSGQIGSCEVKKNRINVELNKNVITSVIGVG